MCRSIWENFLTDDPAAWKVRVGEHNMFEEEGSQVDVEVVKIICHPKRNRKRDVDAHARTHIHMHKHTRTRTCTHAHNDTFTNTHTKTLAHAFTYILRLISSSPRY